MIISTSDIYNTGKKQQNEQRCYCPDGGSGTTGATVVRREQEENRKGQGGTNMRAVRNQEGTEGKQVRTEGKPEKVLG